MKMSSLDHAVAWRNHRQKAIELREAARSGFLVVQVEYNQVRFEPACIIPLDPIRLALVQACSDFIDEKNAELEAIGVDVLK